MKEWKLKSNNTDFFYNEVLNITSTLNTRTKYRKLRAGKYI